MQRERQLHKSNFLVPESRVASSEAELKKLIYDILPPEKIKEVTKQILGIKKYKSAKSGFFAFAWRFAVVASILVYLSTGYSPVKWLHNTIYAQNEIKLRKVELFTSNCQTDLASSDIKTGWWETKKIIGAPQLSNQSDLASFSDTNSAFYTGGQNNLFCENFDNQNPEENQLPQVATTTPEEISSTTEEIVENISTTTEEAVINETQIAVPTETSSSSESVGSSTETLDTTESSTPTESVTSETPSETGEPVGEVVNSPALIEPDTIIVDKTEDAKVEISEPQSQTVEIVSEASETPAADVVTDAITKIWQPVQNFINNSLSNIKVAVFGSKNYAVAVAKADYKNIEELGAFQSAKINLSLAMARKIEDNITENQNPNFTVWYAISPENLIQNNSTSTEASTTIDQTNIVWQELTEFSDLPISNLLNGGYFSFDAPILKSWQDAKNLKIKIEGRVENEAPFVAYFDSVWVEAYYQSWEDKEAQDLRQARWNKMLELLSDRTTFNVDEKGELRFFYKKNGYSLIEQMGDYLGLVDYWKDVNVKIFIENNEGTTLNIPLSTIFDDAGEFTVQIPSAGRTFKPGKYNIKFRIEDNSGDVSEIITLEQGFSWGVLALNFNKSVYTTSEIAYLQMAVLDDYGDTLCNAKLDLEITAPDGGVAYLNSGNGLIMKNPECGPNSTTPKPDYFAYYGLGEEGIYNIKLTAETVNGVKQIAAKLEVVKELPLEIERLGPTRIYPRADYAMKIKIKANEDYSGDVKEVVPVNFRITNYELRIKNKDQEESKIGNWKLEIGNSDNEQQLIFKNIEIKRGDELIFEYIFDAPDVSPEFYLLGPVQTSVFSEARSWQIASDAVGTRAKTVMFDAGIWSGNGTALWTNSADDSDTNQTFSSFDFSLAENNVSIKNAYIVFETQFESYSNYAVSYSGYSLSFDSCEGSCTPSAWGGTNIVTRNDDTVLAYDEAESDQARLLLDVTNEGQLSSYAGNGVSMKAQFGYNIKRGTATSSISFARATLYLTYTYSASSTNLTNTVVYPLESDTTGNSGTMTKAQADDCILNTSCPLFNYKMDLPEYGTYSSRLSQWFGMYNHNYNNLANDITVNVNIQDSDTNSSDFVHESFNSDQGYMPSHFFSGVAGYNENSSQQLEYHALSAGSPTYYLIGGEVFETYVASSSAATKTRTVSFPIGVVNNGLTIATTSTSTDIFFPENGTATGTVKIKKAWLRIKSNNYNNVLASTSVQTKVGDEATSTMTMYEYMPSATMINSAINIIHVIASTSYSEIEKANAINPKTIALITKNSSAANQGGLSAELMVTYTYTSEGNGYLTSINMYGGQPLGNGNLTATTTAIGQSVFPEPSGKTLYGAAIIPSFLSSDRDLAMPTNTHTLDVNISTGTPTCTNAYRSRSDAQNMFVDYIKRVTNAMDTQNNQAYNVCFSNSNAGDTTVGAKMNGIWLYTYGWTNSQPTGSFNSTSTKRDGTGEVELSIEADDPDDDDTRAKLEYVSGADCDFTSSNQATLTTDDASTTADYGDPKISNNSSYQIGSSTGWIITSSGSNSVNTIWNSKSNLPDSEGVYCLRLTVNDNAINQATSATTTVLIDNKAPTAPGPLALSTKNATSVTLLLNATSTETNFREYKIFYKTYDGTAVTESDTLYGSSTNPSMGNILFNGSTTVTIGSLSAGIQYSFKMWTYDHYGNKSSTTQINITVNSYPLGSFNKAQIAQKTDGSGGVDISIEVDDPDNDDEIRARIDYVEGESCDFATSFDPTLDNTQANIQADFGTPYITNANNFQIGSTGGWILTSPGSNTVNFDWLSKENVNNTDITYCLRLIVSDGMNEQETVATATVAIDNISPTAPGNLSFLSSTQNSLMLALGSTSTENHFYRYRVFYKEGLSGVTEFNSVKDEANFNDKLYNGATTTTITGLTPNTWYVINIWAYDNNGNKASATEMTAKTDATVKNQSLTFINPVGTNIALADNRTVANFRAIVTESNGWLNMNTIVLHLADNNDNTEPFDDLAFTWNQSANTFTETGSDANSAISLATSSTADCSGETCTIDFKLKFNYNFTSTSTNYVATLSSTNDSAVTDSDNYTDFYQTRIIKVKQIHYRWRNDDGYE